MIDYAGKESVKGRLTPAWAVFRQRSPLPPAKACGKSAAKLLDRLVWGVVGSGLLMAAQFVAAATAHLDA